MTEHETHSTELDLELRAMWQSSSEEAPAPIDILAEVQRQAGSLRRKVLRRDMIETLAAIFVWVIFAVTAFKAPGLVPKLGLLLGTGFIAAPVWKLHHERRRHRDAPADAPVIQHLEGEIARVEGQIQLLQTVASWYIAPLGIGGTIFVAGFAAAVPIPSLGGRAVAVLATVAFSTLLFLVIGWAIVRLNRRAIEQGLLPMKTELEEALSGLEPPSHSASLSATPASREPSSDSKS